MALAALTTACQPAGPDPRMATMDDILGGHVTGGSLHKDWPQFVCLDELDTLSGIGLDSASRSQMRMQLTTQHRCAYTTPGAGYDMTADGQEQFTTPDGVIALWPATD